VEESAEGGEGKSRDVGCYVIASHVTKRTTTVFHQYKVAPVRR